MQQGAYRIKNNPGPKFYNAKNLNLLRDKGYINSTAVEEFKVLSRVLPFKVSSYVIEELIDWQDIDNDPIFNLVFPGRNLLKKDDYEKLIHLDRSGKTEEFNSFVLNLQDSMNPHPAGQDSHNVPSFQGRSLKGLQHKYDSTVLVFPMAGQTCFSYCTFCFRWPQFVDSNASKFETDKSNLHLEYIKSQKSITDILITGGDPLVMHSRHLEYYIKPFLDPDFSHIKNIRIGSKVLSYWPQRFLHDPDSKKLLALLKEFSKRKHVTLMAHINHPMELETVTARAAVESLREIGVTIRSQSPILRRINDSPEIWAKMWEKQISLGIIPYYMFVERDTGPKGAFEVSLDRAYSIFKQASLGISGLCKTVRGPSMSTFYGKILVDGIVDVFDEKAFCLKFIQARNSDWNYRPFFSKWDRDATWIDDLVPLNKDEKFFFQP